MNRRPAKLASDQRGLILVVAIPMAAILVGCLWYLASLGDAVVYRERLQDAADATALEGAVLHARGMNASALLNIVSSLLLAAQTAARNGEALTSTRLVASAAPPAADPQLSARVAQTVAVVRQLQAGVAAARAGARHRRRQPGQHPLLPRTAGGRRDLGLQLCPASGHCRRGGRRGPCTALVAAPRAAATRRCRASRRRWWARTAARACRACPSPRMTSTPLRRQARTLPRSSHRRCRPPQ